MATDFAALSRSAAIRLFISRFLCEFSQMRRAIYPGSFDPVTNGHLDVIDRARKLFDEVVVAVAHNDEKLPLFSLEQRLDLLRETAGRIENVRIAEISGSRSNSPASKRGRCDPRFARSFGF